MLFWHLFIKPNIILAKTIMLKAQKYFLAKTYFHILKSLIHGKYNYSSPKKYFSYKIYKSPCISPMTKLLIFLGMTNPNEAQL